MQCQSIVFSKLITLGRADCNIKKGEDSGPAGLHIAEVEEHGRHPVLAHLPGLVHRVEVVHVRLVVAPNTVRDNLQRLSIAAIKTHSSAGRVAKMSHHCVEFGVDLRIGSNEARLTNTTTAALDFAR